eukprot:c28722_g1_i1 orf=391-3579(+)
MASLLCYAVVEISPFAMQNSITEMALQAKAAYSHNPSFEGIRRKISLGNGGRGGSGSNFGRRKAGAVTCMNTISVMQEEAVVSVMENGMAELSSLNSKSIILSKDANRESDGELLMKPAPKQTPGPQLKREGTSVDFGSGNGSRGRGSGSSVSTYKVVYKPGDKTFKANNNAELEGRIDSLGDILDKAEALILDNGSNSGIRKEDRYSRVQPNRKGTLTDARGKNSIWRKDSLASSKDAPDGSQVNDSGEFSFPNDGSGATTSASTLPAVKPNLQPRKISPGSTPLKLRLTPPSKQDASLGRKEPGRRPILRDIGAADKPPSQPVGYSAKTAQFATVASVATPLVSPTQSGKGGPKSKDMKGTTPKGRGQKLDWKSKSSSEADSLKRRLSSLEEEANDVAARGVLVASGRRRGQKMTKAIRKAARAEAAKAAAPVRVDILEVGNQGMPLQDLAQKLAINVAEIVKTLFLRGIVTAVNQTLDEDTVKLVCREYNVEVVEAGSQKVEELAKRAGEFIEEEDLDQLQTRPPVVTIMGHVDHGKTTLLDHIRQSKVAASEAGGITQGIGAYRVLVPVDGEPQSCVFLDTPGHEAFSAMRARGARITDIAIIVVAADDGVQPQTQEAIAHAKAANVPIVIAINKVDKEDAEPERVMQELSAIGILAEEWGGDVPIVMVSALKGQNMDALLETVMLVAEFQDLKANPNRNAKGTVIEACLDKSKGVMATLLVQNGTLKKGDVVLCGKAHGKVRAMLDDTGARVEEAMPSAAVQVIGFSSVPDAGDEFEVLDSLDLARQKAEECAETQRMARITAQAGEGKVTLSSLASAVAERLEMGVERHQLNIVLKVDVQGSIEAIREALQILPQDTVSLRFLMQAPGDITASDVDLAIASEAVIIGFNVGMHPAVQAHAERKGVEIRLYRVIYELLEDIRNAMEGLLEPLQEQVPIGKAEVRAIFSSGSGKVAGCMVIEGKLGKGCCVQVTRGKTVVTIDSLTSLRRVKENVKEVSAGLECGVGMETFNEWQIGDTIEAFELAERKRTLEDASTATASVVAAVSENACKLNVQKM